MATVQKKNNLTLQLNSVEIFFFKRKNIIFIGNKIKKYKSFILNCENALHMHHPNHRKEDLNNDCNYAEFAEFTTTV